MSNQTKTLGEQRVRTTFNPSNDSVVDQIKQKSAELINLIEEVKQKGMRHPSEAGEIMRWCDHAQTSYEAAAMWAVKAATA